ncbi:hypothetical protein [Thalassospira sp. TSL5-1]|uniref:hypothetical protein n=1 Tax=Thalassospira sp. TSL5-1 TaxID=1544451 RepID=UPI0011612D71|nr:hypothetical protein [Thalassospira sp. TSL5-1]
MPILTLTVSPALVEPLTLVADDVADHLLGIIREHLAPRAGTEQIMFVPALGVVRGCALLAKLEHRASESRSMEIRKACADAIAHYLAQKFATSVRVRLIALDPQNIGASDIGVEAGL